MDVKRYWRHLTASRLATRKAFPRATLKAIEATIKEVEAHHDGEICFVVETSIDRFGAGYQPSPRQRALEVFAQRRIWDTEYNNGILLYVLMADRAVEIVCDRGINAHADRQVWEQICARINADFQQHRFREGAIDGIKALAEVLEQHYPGRTRRNDLSDHPQVD